MDDAQLQVHLTTVKPSNKRATLKVVGDLDVGNGQAGGTRVRVWEYDCQIIWGCWGRAARAGNPGMELKRTGGRRPANFFAHSSVAGGLGSPLSQRTGRTKPSNPHCCRWISEQGKPWLLFLAFRRSYEVHGDAAELTHSSRPSVCRIFGGYLPCASGPQLRGEKEHLFLGRVCMP